MTLSQTSNRIIKKKKNSQVTPQPCTDVHFNGLHAMNSDCMYIVQILTYYECKEALVLASLQLYSGRHHVNIRVRHIILQSICQIQVNFYLRDRVFMASYGKNQPYKNVSYNEIQKIVPYLQICLRVHNESFIKLDPQCHGTSELNQRKHACKVLPGKFRFFLGLFNP